MKSAFCCVSLRTGTLIIGWTFLVFSVLNVLFTIYVVELSTQEEEGDADYGVQNFTSPRPKPEVEITFRVYNSPYVVYGTTLLNMLVLAALLYGTYKKMPALLPPFVVLYGVSTIVTVPLVIYWFVMGVHIILLSPIIVSIPICFYSVCVVWNYYKHLRSENIEPKDR